MSIKYRNMRELKNFLAGRIDRNQRLLENARKSYEKTKDSSWEARVAELAGRQDELRVILAKVERIIEFNF